jgi:hypothetical protein
MVTLLECQLEQPGFGGFLFGMPMPLSRPELCRQKAIECESEAKRASDGLTADAWLNMAKQWRELADRIERYSPGG